MISTFFLTIFNSFLGLLLSFLPSGNLPTGITDAIQSIWGIINTFSYLIAVDTLLAAVLIALSFDLALLLWRVINWIIRKIPGMQ